MHAGGAEAARDMEPGHGRPSDVDVTGSDCIRPSGTATTDSVTGSEVSRQTPTRSAVPSPPFPPPRPSPTAPPLRYRPQARRPVCKTKQRFLYCCLKERSRVSGLGSTIIPDDGSGAPHLAQSRRAASRGAFAAMMPCQHYVACSPAGGYMSQQSSSSMYRRHVSQSISRSPKRLCIRGLLPNRRHAHSCVTNSAWTRVMSPKEALTKGFTERCVAMGLGAHEMLGVMFPVAARCGPRCNEARGGVTLVARE